MSLVPVPNPQNGNPALEVECRQASLQELLTLATGLTNTNDGGNQNANDMDEERKKFLRKALEGVAIDLAAEVNKSLRFVERLTNDHHPNIEMYALALEKLSTHVHMLDVAKVFYKLGGKEVMIPLLIYPHGTIQALAADVIAVCCQNNIYCQTKSLDNQLFCRLMNLGNNNFEEVPQLKGISAISAILRHNRQAVGIFRWHDGFSMLSKAMTSQNEKIVIKVLFLINVLSDTNTTTRDDMLEVGIVKKLISLVKIRGTPANQEDLKYNDSVIVSEYALRNLVSISNSKRPQVIELCRQRKEELLNYIQEIIKAKGSDEAFMEWMAYAKILQSRITENY